MVLLNQSSALFFTRRVRVMNLPVLSGRSPVQTILTEHCVHDGVIGGAVSLMAGHRLPLPAGFGAAEVN